MILKKFQFSCNIFGGFNIELDVSLVDTKEDIIKAEIEKISLKRIAKTNEIASVILFLASEKSSYINGQNIVADGGNL